MDPLAQLDLSKLLSDPESLSKFLRELELQANVSSILNNHGVAGGFSGSLPLTNDLKMNLDGYGYKVDKGPTGFGIGGGGLTYRPDKDTEYKFRVGKDRVDLNYRKNW